jgi:hypothetical protein
MMMMMMMMMMETILGLFKEAFQLNSCTGWYGKITGNDMDGGARDLFYGTISALARR